MEQTLDPPVVCCGRVFRLQRALTSHESNHLKCSHCSFEGCRAALKAHEWDDHGIGKPPITATAQAAVRTYKGRAGGEFDVVDELEAEVTPLEARFPGAEIVWTAPTAKAQCSAVTSSGDAGSADEVRCADEPELEWPAACRVIMIVGATASGKSRLLRSLAPAAAGTATVESDHWPASRSILDGLGAEGHRWLAAVGLGSVPLWCQPYAVLSTGEAFRAELARRLQAATESVVARYYRPLATTYHRLLLRR